MSVARRVPAVLTEATPVRSESRRGLVLSFRTERTRLAVERIDDFADLGPELSLQAVLGLGKVLRILRAARIAAPPDPKRLLGRETEAAELVGRALETPLRLDLRPRSRVRFVAWTESGVESVDDVAEVLESPDTYFVMRRNGRYPVRVPRSAVVRQRTEVERWYEVVGVERNTPST